MLASIVLAFTLTLVTQSAPAPTRPTATSPTTTRATTSPTDPAKPAGMSQRRWEELQRTTAKKRAFKSRRVLSGKAREAQWEAEEKAAIAKAEKDYQKALPFLLENQRQQLERLSAYERNQALQRMAAASDKIAQAIQYQAVYRPSR